MEDDEYRKLAAVEDRMWYFRALHAHALDRLRLVRIGAGDRLLDAGCGTGGFIRQLTAARPGLEIAGIDLSPLATGLARERCAARIYDGSVTALPFADGQFAAVTSLDVIYHLDDPAAALAEFHRVLAPGGVVVLNVPAYRWLWSYHDIAVHARHRFTRPEMTALLTTAGFGEVWGTYWNSLPLPLIVVKRKFLGGKPGDSDVRLFPRWIEGIFNGAMACERAWIRKIGRCLRAARC